jgi:hypothetical protein
MLSCVTRLCSGPKPPTFVEHSKPQDGLSTPMLGPFLWCGVAWLGGERQFKTAQLKRQIRCTGLPASLRSSLDSSCPA